MINIKQSSQLSKQEQILKKLKKLKNDIEYSTSTISNKLSSDSINISRLADVGEIVKTRKGFFYKPTSKTIYKKSNKTSPLNKSIFINDLFWSVKDGFEVSSDDLIEKYLVEWNEEDLMALFGLFGYKRLLSATLKIYKKRTDENYKKIRTILERFDKWRLDDKRD